MGTLDGIERISRLGEELYHTDNYVGIVEGSVHHHLSSSQSHQVGTDRQVDGLSLVNGQKA